MSDPQLEALAVLVEAHPDSVLATGRKTAHGWIGTVVARSLVELGYAREDVSMYYIATEAGRTAYQKTMS